MDLLFAGNFVLIIVLLAEKENQSDSPALIARITQPYVPNLTTEPVSASKGWTLSSLFSFCFAILLDLPYKTLGAPLYLTYWMSWVPHKHLASDMFDLGHE